MSKFDLMIFSSGDTQMFVANAKIYSRKDVVSKCIMNNYRLFADSDTFRRKNENRLRMPVLNDVQACFCSEYPDGCYILVGAETPRAFPVLIIDFKQLMLRRDAYEGSGECNRGKPY